MQQHGNMNVKFLAVSREVINKGAKYKKCYKIIVDYRLQWTQHLFKDELCTRCHVSVRINYIG
jgi:hypothetical protein